MGNNAAAEKQNFLSITEIANSMDHFQPGRSRGGLKSIFVINIGRDSYG